MLVVKRASRTLTPKELANSFKKFQQSKPTKLGEILHAHQGPLSTLIDGIMWSHRDQINQIFSSSGKSRFQDLEVYARCLYRYLGGSSPFAAPVKEFWSRQLEPDFTLPSDNKIRNFRLLMLRTFNLLIAENNASIRTKRKIYIPLFMLMHWSFKKGTDKHRENVEYLDENLADIVNSEEFAVVANKDRGRCEQLLDYLKEKVTGG